MTEEKTKLQKTKDWFSNQKYFVVLAILFLGFIAVSQVFKASKEIKDAAKELFTKADSSELNSKNSLTEITLNSLKGRVVDIHNHPLSNAKIEIYQIINEFEYTDDSGIFIFNNMKTAAKYIEIIILKEGFKTLNKKILLDNNESNYDMGKIVLEKNIPQLGRSTNHKNGAISNDIKGGSFHGDSYIGNDKVTINKVVLDTIK